MKKKNLAVWLLAIFVVSSLSGVYAAEKDKTMDQSSMSEMAHKKKHKSMKLGHKKTKAAASDAASTANKS